jgi:hypothetical protein
MDDNLSKFSQPISLLSLSYQDGLLTGKIITPVADTIT